MILRTPPPRKRRATDSSPSSTQQLERFDHRSSGSASGGGLVIYEDPDTPLHVGDSTHNHPPSDQMICTYQCRQMVKADFLDAFENAEKQVKDYQSQLETLTDQLQKSEAERNKFRDQFNYTEQELAGSKGREKALQDQLMKEIDDCHDRIQKQTKSYSELEVKFQKEVNLRKNAESSEALAKDKAISLEEKFNHLSGSIERERRHLNDELSQFKKESKLSLSRIKADLERMECRAYNAEKESELLKQQLEDLRIQLDECRRQKNEAERKILCFSSPSNDVNSSETLILVKHLQEELRNYESEVQEARMLKSSHENNELMQVKLLEEKGRRERAESELLKLQEVQLSVKKLEDEIMTWRSMINEIPGVSCSDDIPIKFASLQKEVIQNMMKIGEVTAQLKEIEVVLEATERGKQHAESEAKLAKEKAEQSMSEVKRLELLDLENALAKKECSITELESQLCEQKEVISRQHGEIKLLTERLSNEARRLKSLERESDRLRSEISLLESKVGHGDFSAASTKVLRMVNTLAVDNEAKQTIETLRTELQKTKEKLQAVQELKGQSADGGNLIDANISEKLAQLKAQIATLEKREERYKTVFAEKISVFRRACCSLFGYKIVMDDRQRSDGIPVTRFILQSLYAQTDDEKLEFEYESGNTNILGNDYASQPEIARQVEIFIRKMNSIPAFTANLTMESFNRRTLS
ncbi:hypothetical protein AQUCO_01400040v1 [Aquilegia coerulea]|uniref:Spindle assembly checkpoint component MAD1 n=1 Tax=Aquilegia coerulea TaxID=218851 RepID=A0A2G5DU75_AQUCA|nr:hypothetical protein AQUCO_01400040v1 [Aquilegia coerulea]